MRYILFLLVLNICCGNSLGQQPGRSFPAWTPGTLDIHHINTGHGVSAFFVLPDGTTLLVDAGELDPTDERTRGPRNSKMHPNESKEAYQWIGDYIRQFHPDRQSAGLDYAMITHYHDDHFGIVHPRSPKSASGNYRLSGITGVGTEIKIAKLIDRGYTHPFDLKHDSVKQAATRVGGTALREYKNMQNYWAFSDEHAARGMRVEMLQAGRNDQIRLLRNPSAFPSFFVNNVKANGTIWTGTANTTTEYFPLGHRPSENPLSLAIRLDYGNFRYYTGGDNPGITDLGASKFNDTETPMSAAIGEVDVAVMDHHGNRDAHNEYNVRTLRPRVWIEQVWSSDHPGHDVLRRVTSRYLYPGDRDLFATNMLEPNKLVIGPLIDQAYKSTDGHIVVRVSTGGDEYHVIILNDENETREVTAVFGPYKTQIKQ